MTTSGGDPLKSDDLMNDAGARWCDQHKRHECTKKSKRRPGDHCHASAIRGTNACRIHGGQSTAVLKAKGEALSAWRATPGVQAVSPSEAVMQMLQVSWARFHLYAGLLEQQVTEAQDDGGSGLGGSDVPDLGPGAGLIGHTRSGVKDIGIFATGEAARGLTLLEEKERDRTVRYAKTAHDMGIADREIRLAESQGAQIAEVIKRVLAAMLERLLLELGRELAARIAAAWAEWIAELVPRELLAIAGEADTP